MAIINTVSVYIDGINRTSNAVMPLKWSNFLDERLDECVLSLRGIKKEVFEPLTPVEIELKNKLYWSMGKSGTPTKIRTTTKHYVVATDTVSETQLGSGLYDHDLYLIEVTKIAECVVVDTLTFTNDLGRNYAKGAITVEARDKGWDNIDVFNGTPKTYVTPLQTGTRFTFVSYNQVFGGASLSGGFKVYYNDKQIFETKDKGVEFSTRLKSGFYKIEYMAYAIMDNGTVLSEDLMVSFTFLVIDNYLPLKSWTITDVINRTLDLCEPLRQGEKARFMLQGMNIDGSKQEGSQAAMFDEILSPEFSFTKQTLRECLKEIGKVIHGEPRLEPQKDEEGNYYYEVSFDMYSSQEQSDIHTIPYIKKTASQVIDSYASNLDSRAENLVNQLDKYQGVIIEPYYGGAKTVRTERVYARIADSNMLIQTQYPIYSVDKLEYVYADGDEIKMVDITAYLFERSIYEAQLSSYNSQPDDKFSYSKAYGLFYTQGSKNIGGLNFKEDAAIFPAFKNYAILNILKQAIGGDYKPPESSSQNINYYNMAFRVTYTPFYNARIGQTKPYYKDFKRPAALIFNQQSNVIESRYYGENLKGAIARLGNVEKSLTFHLTNLKTIPKAGQMYDKDYYISAVAVEYLPTIIKCTIGLSKDFNRLSAYIGISSVKRYSEISQTQAVERNVLYHEYVVIGDKEEPDFDCLIGENSLSAIASIFSGLGTYFPLSNVCAWGTSKSGHDMNVVYLPIISSAFGNSISFSWRYEDNYSAGAISQYQANNEVSGYFQNNYQYTDYYGRLYYYNFYIEMAGPTPKADTLEQIGRDLPKGENLPAQRNFAYISTVNRKPYLMRKDNRESLQINYQIDFVTNKENLIIGSALASYCPLVRGRFLESGSYKASLYVFDTELNKFTDHVEAYENVKLADMPKVDVTVTLHPGEGYFEVSADAFPATESGAIKGKSWAIVTPQVEETTEVEDEDGNTVQQITYKGGDLLIGQNIDVAAGSAFTPIYFTKKREIFDKSVWKDRR